MTVDCAKNVNAPLVFSEKNAINAAKKSATDAATHPPIVGTNHNWWTWDPDSGDYIDSGIAIEPERTAATKDALA